MRVALLPQKVEFYELFEQAGRNALAAAELAEQRLREFPDTGIAHARIKELEHEGDRLTGELIRLLNTQFVTPLDREDIYALATALDDVVDHIEHGSDLLGLYKVEAPMEQATAQARILVGAAGQLVHALAELRRPSRIEPFLVELKRLEDEGDRIVRDAIAALFEDEGVNPREIIRWKDIFEALEDAIDACERAGHVIGNVVVKNA